MSFYKVRIKKMQTKQDCVCVCVIIKADEKKTILHKPSSVQERRIGSIATSLLAERLKRRKEGRKSTKGLIKE